MELYDLFMNRLREFDIKSSNDKKLNQAGFQRVKIYIQRFFNQKFNILFRYL